MTDINNVARVSGAIMGEISQISPVVTREDIIAIQKLVRAMPVADHVLAYAVDLAAATRPKQAGTGRPPAPTSSGVRVRAPRNISSWARKPSR